MSNGMTEFRELTQAPTRGRRSLVISKELISNTFTLAEMTEVPDGHRTTKIFFKGAIQVDSLDHLKMISEALKEAIKIIELADNKQVDTFEKNVEKNQKRGVHFPEA